MAILWPWKDPSTNFTKVDTQIVNFYFLERLNHYETAGFLRGPLLTVHPLHLDAISFDTALIHGDLLAGHR